MSSTVRGHRTIVRPRHVDETPMVSWHEDVIHTFRMGIGTRFGVHQHNAHQFAWATEGSLQAQAVGRCWIVAGATALWIPPYVDHDMIALTPTTMHSLCFHSVSRSLFWPQTESGFSPIAIHFDRLMQSVAERLLRGSLTEDERFNLERVLADCCHRHASAGVAMPPVALPTDDRARRVAQGIFNCPADKRTLKEWADLVGASQRTLLRLFRVETGIGFEQWRRHARMHIAHTLLLDAMPVERCARSIGYDNPSAFGAAFRATFGYPPSDVAKDERTYAGGWSPESQP